MATAAEGETGRQKKDRNELEAWTMVERIEKKSVCGCENEKKRDMVWSLRKTLCGRL